MQSFEVEILKSKAANILYDLRDMKLIRLKEKKVVVKKKRNLPKEKLMLQIERGLKDVARIQSGKTKPKTIRELLNAQ